MRKKIKIILNILFIIVFLLSSTNNIYANKSITSDFIYYYIEDDLEVYNLWDFVDIVMAGESWCDLLKDPSFKNLSWAILDSVAIAPLIPSTKWIRHGAKYVLPMSEIKKLASTTSGKKKLKKAIKVTSKSSELKKITNLAKNYILTENRYREHIWKLHGYNSVRKNKSKFKKGFNIKKGIKDTLTSDSIIKNNTKSREGYIFIKKYSNYIGFDKDRKTKLYRLKVVLSSEGKIITAYPIK